VGHEIASRIAYLGEDLETAADVVVNHDLATHHIGAGVVAIDAKGRISTPYNTPGMFRGWVTPEGTAFVATHETIYEIAL
jgi:beta-aspartyl-peptidase (threonine type)